MELRTKECIPLEDADIFSQLYPPLLQMSIPIKFDLSLSASFRSLYLFVDDELTGEIFGLSVHDIYGSGDDCPGFDILGLSPDKAFYVYSLAIIEKHRGKGFAKYLKTELVKMLTPPITAMVGHAQEGASINISESLGARIIKPFENWYDSNKTHWLYQLDLR